MSARVLIVTALWPEEARDSTGNFVFDQTAALQALGVDVTVIVFRPWSLHRRRASAVAALPGAKVLKARYFAPPASGFLGQTALRLVVRNAGRAVARVLRSMEDLSFDAVHLHELLPTALSYAAWRQGLMARRAVLTLHGFDPLVLGKSAGAAIRARLDGAFQELDVIGVVGTPLKRALEGHGVPPEKIEVIWNGARPPAQGSDRSAHPTSSKPLVVLSVCNLVALKGVDLNLRALAAIAQGQPEVPWEYRIIGAGPEHQRLVGLAEELGLTDRVCFLGRLDHEETLAEMAAADIFSLPSWGEAFGIVYVEAMGGGCPVIGCRAWGAADIIEDGVQGLLVEPRDLVSLQDALTRLLTDPALRAAAGAAAQERARQFTWESNARRYLAYYTLDTGTSIERSSFPRGT